MINLISPERKRDVAAARINAKLVRFGIALLMLAAVIAAIYGFGFWLLWQDEQSVKAKLATQDSEAQAYAKVEKEANEFRQNLAIAKRILGAEKTYSSFLTQLARDMPSGTVLTNLSLGGPTTTSSSRPAGTLIIEARATSYAKVLELKNSLEQSQLFENVSIVNTARPESISTLAGLEAKYAYKVSLSVKQSASASIGDAQ